MTPSRPVDPSALVHLPWWAALLVVVFVVGGLGLCCFAQMARDRAIFERVMRGYTGPLDH